MHFQNWLANFFLRNLTGNVEAVIVDLTVPFKTEKRVEDEFQRVFESLIPFVMVLIYVLPIKRILTRIVSEKGSGAKELMKVMGMSETSYWLSWFIYYFAVSLIISIVSTLILSINVFPHSNKFLIFLYFFLYGLSLFGYIVLTSSFFNRPLIASLVGSLFFFFTSFADYIVDSKYISATKKNWASML